MWVLVNFFKDIPKELEDAAEIDGCTPFSVSKSYPSISCSWYCNNCYIGVHWGLNELFAFVFTTNETVRTLPVGIVMFRENMRFHGVTLAQHPLLQHYR